MQTEKPRRSLRDALYSSAEEPTPAQQRCALSFDRPCCHGRGYNIATKGIYTVAELCSCVKQCPICLGHTMINDHDSGMRPCRQPSPNRVAAIINDSHLPARYAFADLERFDNFTGNGKQIIQRVKSWINEFVPHASKGIILGGPVGVGKTFLLASLVKAIAHKGISVKFVDFFQLLAEIKAGYSENKADMSILAPLIDVEVLAIDELGKGRNTEFELTILDQLVMGRYNANKPIIASTNCTFLDQTKQYQYNIPLDQEPGRKGSFEPENFGSLESRVGKRIYSRLLETTYTMDLTGADYRRR